MAEQKKPRERKKIWVKPTEGMRIKHPVSFVVLPPEGMLVEASSYWTRKILDKDIVECEPPKGEAQPVKEPKKGKE